jgi:hypothetical protein
MFALAARSLVSRSESAKGLVDHADIRRLLLSFPEFKAPSSAVADRLRDSNAAVQVREAWREIAALEIVAEYDDDGH